MSAFAAALRRLARIGTAPGAPLGSLRGQLLRWLLVPLLAIVAINSFSLYRDALEAADIAYDRSLLASTRALAERVSVREGKVVADVPYVALDSFETDTLGRIFYRVTGLRGETVSGYGDLPPVPANVPRSELYPALVRFYHAVYNGEPVRIAALLQPVYDDSMRGIALIQVGETLDARRALSRRILVNTLARQAVLVLAVGTLVWFAVRLVLAPLMRLKNEVETRPLTDLSDVDQALVHREVRPLVSAMNGAMGRLQQLIAGQRRFIADASHQLRTPLTVLKTQAELALRENDPTAMREIVRSIAATSGRTSLCTSAWSTSDRSDRARVSTSFFRRISGRSTRRTANQTRVATASTISAWRSRVPSRMLRDSARRASRVSPTWIRAMPRMESS